ncbi:MAG: hypothetical protein RLZZ516_1537 [Cyanobacteriota bacterium]
MDVGKGLEQQAEMAALNRHRLGSSHLAVSIGPPSLERRQERWPGHTAVLRVSDLSWPPCEPLAGRRLEPGAVGRRAKTSHQTSHMARFASRNPSWGKPSGGFEPKLPKLNVAGSSPVTRFQPTNSITSLLNNSGGHGLLLSRCLTNKSMGNAINRTEATILASTYCSGAQRKAIAASRPASAMASFLAC